MERRADVLDALMVVAEALMSGAFVADASSLDCGSAATASVTVSVASVLMVDALEENGE